MNAAARRKRIGVLLVDDSPLALEIIRGMLAGAPEIEVLATASNGLEALKLIPQLLPEVICTDLHMPGMDGLEMTREVMARFPTPILVLSASIEESSSQNSFAMLQAGAIDVMEKPVLRPDAAAASAQELIRRIRIVSGVKVFRRAARPKGAARLPDKAASASLAAPSSEPPLPPVDAAAMPGILGIGSSTGGPQALEQIFRALPGDFPLPVLCVQHIGHGFNQGLVDWLAGSSRLQMRIASDGELPLPGTVYFAPDDRHLEIGENARLHCSAKPPAGGHRPSADLMLASLAECYGRKAAGVLLTGMGHDGAQGLLEIRRAGGITLVQDEASSIVFGMPKRAIELGAATYVLPLEQIAPALLALVRKGAA